MFQLHLTKYKSGRLLKTKGLTRLYTSMSVHLWSRYLNRPERDKKYFIEKF